MKFYRLTLCSKLIFIILSTCGQKNPPSKITSVEAYSRQLGLAEGTLLEGKFKYAVFKWDNEKKLYGRMLCNNPTVEITNAASDPTQCDAVMWIKEEKVLKFAKNYMNPENLQTKSTSLSKMQLTHSDPARAQQLTSHISAFKSLVDAQLQNDKTTDKEKNLLRADYQAEIRPQLNELVRITEGIDFAESFIEGDLWDQGTIDFIRSQTEALNVSPDTTPKTTFTLEDFSKALQELKGIFSTDLTVKIDSAALRGHSETIRPVLQILNNAFDYVIAEHERTSDELSLYDAVTSGNLRFTSRNHFPFGIVSQLEVKWAESNGTPAPAREMLPKTISVLNAMVLLSDTFLVSKENPYSEHKHSFDGLVCQLGFRNFPNDSKLLVPYKKIEAIIPTPNDFWTLKKVEREPKDIKSFDLIPTEMAISGTQQYSTAGKSFYKTYFSSISTSNAPRISISCDVRESDSYVSSPLVLIKFSDFKKLLTSPKTVKSVSEKLASIFRPATEHVLFESIKLDINNM